MTLDRRAAESWLAFWSDAGVDCLYQDAPSGRLTEERPPRPARVAPGPSAPVIVAPDLAEARELARTAESLAALREAIAAFDGCALKRQGARQAVCWRGAERAPVMVIGEAPGAEEDARGEPFVGKAGQLLDKMLAAAGLEGRVLISNTVLWRPPGNRTPSLEEQMACAPFLERAIDLVRPRLLLLVGAASAKFLLDRSEGILALRGRWFEWSARHADLKIPAMPTLHPAFLLRQPAAKKKAWSDLLMLAERLDRDDRPE